MKKVITREVKIAEELRKISHKCKCGHTVFIPNNLDFVYCKWCWNTVYKNEQTKFKRKLLKKCGKGINEQISQ